jgi:hypothetical protein
MNFRRFALAVYIVATIIVAVAGYFALRNEMTGIATYHRGIKGSKSETVTRENAPAKFRDATNEKWELSIISLVVAVGSFVIIKR